MFYRFFIKIKINLVPRVRFELTTYNHKGCDALSTLRTTYIHHKSDIEYILIHLEQHTVQQF